AIDPRIAAARSGSALGRAPPRWPLGVGTDCRIPAALARHRLRWHACAIESTPPAPRALEAIPGPDHRAPVTGPRFELFGRAVTYAIEFPSVSEFTHAPEITS